MIELDHLAVAGETLDAATEHVEAALGVPLQPGGEHVHFGTHNRLLGLEDGLYLEAIAINPAGPKPNLTRWFDLDRFSGAPRLCNWIARTGDLAGEIGRLRVDRVDVGQPVALARGDLRWQMAVPASGVLPFDNLFPALIEWQGDLHPAPMLRPSGCRLARLVIAHPDAAELRALLAPILAPTPIPTPITAEDRIVIEPGASAIQAEFDTPHGRRVLR